MKKLFHIIIILYGFTHAQVNKEIISGKISYISSQHVYVQFVNTSSIKTNDTLYLKTKSVYEPILLVKYISTRSCACVPVKANKLVLEEEIFAFGENEIEKNNIEPKNEVTLKQTISGKEQDIPAILKKENQQSSFTASQIKGRASVQSYSNFSNISGSVPYQTWRYVIAGEAEHIEGTNLSVNTYLNFYYRADEWNKVGNNVGRNLSVYDLAAKYDFNKNLMVRAGRFIDRRISTMGAVDGLQSEVQFGSNFTGVLLGSRPNFGDYGYNAKLFQAGGYFGRTDTLKDGTTENIFAVFHQTNNFKTDRQFLYIQHTNNIFKSIFFFLNSEIDLYKRNNGKGKNTFDLTSFYLMSRYSPFRWISLSASYDARKRILYYESYKNFNESFFDNNLRQGLRFNINLRPISYLSLGINSGYRYQKNDVRPSRSIGGYLNYSSIPILKLSSTMNYSKMISSYSDWDSYGISINKDFLSGILNFAGSFRKTKYKYTSSNFNSSQNILSLDCSIQIIRSIYSNISYEGIFEKRHTYGRISIDLTGRIN